MTPDDITQIIFRELHRIAPDANLQNLPLDADLRNELDLDSMDVLRFVKGLHDALGVSVPESDYRQIASVRACRDYLAKKVV